MEKYGQRNITVLKREKKDVLLTNKDPHLSRIFGQNGPQTPNSASAENLAQAAMDVDGNYTEERNAQEYQLFNEQGASFMAGLAQEQPQLIMGMGRPVAYNVSDSRAKNVVSNENINTHAEIEKMPIDANERHLHGHRLLPKMYAAHSLASSNKNRDGSPVRKPSDADLGSRTNAISINRGWNGVDSASKQVNTETPARPPSLVVTQDVSVENKRLIAKDGEKVNSVQLLSAPPENYNMQLLAHSAQQQQQILLMQQRQQQELYGQGSSSAALQQLAKLRQQQEQAAELSEGRPPPTSKSSPFSFLLPSKDDIKMTSYVKSLSAPFLVPAQAGVFPAQLPGSLAHASGRSPYHITSNYGGWQGSERSTPDFVRGHIRDLSFGSQGSPVHSLLSNEATKSVKIELPESGRKQQTLPTTFKNDGPELRSPLDHPEHQIDQQRNRFFSNDTVTPSAEDRQNSDDEAPLNERDKKAAAAIGELLEQNEKVPTALSTSFESNSAANADVRPQHPQDFAALPIASAGPMRKLQLQQEIARNTPPPAYEQPLLPEQALQHMLQSAGGHPSLVLAPQQALVAMETSSVKQEAITPVVTSGHYYLPTSAQPEPRHVQDPTGVVENQSNYMFQNAERQQIGDPGVTTSSRIGLGITSCPPDMPVDKDSYGTVRASSTTTKSSAPGRPRKTSSSGSERKKSGGNLTCNLCGHSFRSTPALNGHMRVHSASDKKHNKEERKMRTASADLANTTPPAATNVSPSASYRGEAKQAGMPASVDMSMGGDMSHSQQYALDPQNVALQNRGHNGLLTMASAACYLKTDTTGAEYIHPPVLPQAYVVPHTMLFQQPSVVNVFNSNFPENQIAVKSETTQAPGDVQGMNYSQIYAAPFQQGLPFGNISFLPNVPQVPQSLAMTNAVYDNAQQQQQQQQQQPVVSGLDRADVPLNAQNYGDQQDIEVKPMFAIAPEESYQSQYAPQQLVDTNSLSQLASIAVAAANRDHVPDMSLQGDFQESYPQNEEQPTIADPIAPPAHEWMSTSVAPDHHHQDCIPQQEMYQNSNLAPETPPIRSGHDPYILPVTVPVPDEQQGRRFNEYNSNSSSGHRDLMVTWKDNLDVESQHNALISSYDDPLMQEAVDVANPSKILPNSMMGGNPAVGSLFSGARPFRQRHHSEGAHLIKSSETSLLKQILHSPVPTVKLRGATASSADQAPTSSEKQFNQSGVPNTQTSDKAAEKTVKMTPPAKPSTKKVEEFWAEPKPIQRRIRRRRHSADCRLQLKSGQLANGRQHQLVSPNKNANLLRSEVRVRPRPPPLVIPSSVSTFAPGIPPPHPAFYQSNLHHRRRPSGDSCSSYNGVNDKIPPYTPPPMLSPRRAGSGLFCTTPITPMFNRQKSVDGAIPTIPEEDETQEEDEELVRSSEPKINIGDRFQAVVPDKCSKTPVFRCKHKADRVWIPEATEKDDATFKHAEQLMELSCSAVVPFGGSNKEYALDCLAQTKGDILAAVKRLVKRKPDDSALLKPGKQYPGCGKAWTTQEAKLFDTAMVDNRKDFYVISKMVKTRSTAECVERYYHVTKRIRRRVRLPRRFRDQDNDNLMSMLGNLSPENMKIDSLTSASSDDEDLTSKKKPYSGADIDSWQPTDQFSARSPQRHAPAYYHTAQQSGNTPSAAQQIAAKHLKTHAARVQHGQGVSSSPAGSPLSNVSNDEPTQIFTCPVCGKSFGKVKSRNAHMKTHGKQAQEKRRLREEEAARRNRGPPGHHPTVAPVHRPNFAHPTPQLFQHSQHPAMQHPHSVVPRFGHNM